MCNALRILSADYVVGRSVLDGMAGSNPDMSSLFLK